MFHYGMSSGNIVETHMIVKRYWLPPLVFERGPTQSVIT